MIIIQGSDLWVLLGMALAVIVLVFMGGWHAHEWFRGRRVQVDQAVRRHPSTVHRPDHLPRPGRFPVDCDETSIDIARHWTALERNAGPVTTPLSQVELSNWERKIARDNRAWMHRHGIPDELR
jgi:hypothetical protein